MSDYTPTKKDLEDFKEFCKERETVEFCGIRRNINIYKIHRFGSEFKITRIALVEIMKSLLAVLDSWKTMSLLERLNVFNLFGYDPKELIHVINSELSSNDISAILNGKTYTYLLNDLKSVIGDYSIEVASDFLDYAASNHILPYTIFNTDINLCNIEDLLARQELIERTPSYDRPIYWIREFILKEGDNRGYWNYPEHDENIIDVTFRRFMKMLLFECQNIENTMYQQFGVRYAYVRGSNIKKKSVVLSKTNILLIETYFDVRFTNLPDVSKRGYNFVLNISNKTLLK